MWAEYHWQMMYFKYQCNNDEHDNIFSKMTPVKVTDFEIYYKYYSD